MTEREAYDIIHKSGDDVRFPHCDTNVLHAPGDCQFCDMHPEWQALRKIWGISFTGKAEDGKLPCPAEFKRAYKSLNKWHGNQATSKIP